MKFESMFGLGEVCIYNDDLKRDDRMMKDLLVKIVSIVFEEESKPQYIVEWVSQNGTLHRMPVKEKYLVGDPDFDDETGYAE